ncbi:hypothetical protein POM88_036812 [Heracleum sosnowskyi]|uniref:Uncharacterized protein n=1 Tax=Heracleum sosnowskyi TaxID=360622 RepID=A0AAD8HRE7_9APIA|nr:hypothetical protein POM88_036812 [Heracleum sosnowskyi]
MYGFVLDGACDVVIHWNEVQWNQDPVYRENHLVQLHFHMILPDFTEAFFISETQFRVFALNTWTSSQAYRTGTLILTCTLSVTGTLIQFYVPLFFSSSGSVKIC